MSYRSCPRNPRNLKPRALAAVGLVLALGLVLGSAPGARAQAQAQEREEPEGPSAVVERFAPIIAQSARDGLLLGWDFRLAVGPWEVGVGGAYGVESHRVRYRTSFGYRRALEVSYGDWPRSFVLGREGEQGTRLSIDLIGLYRLLQGEGLRLEWAPLEAALARSQLRGTGFLGRLWPGAGAGEGEGEGEGPGPEVRYAHLRGFTHWPLPGGALETRGELLFGQTVPAAAPFQTFFSASRLRLGPLTLEWRLGELDNPAGLPGFRFDLGLRSYPRPIVGDRFWLVMLERRFEVVSGFLAPIDLRDLLGPELGWIPVRASLQASIFFEGGAVFRDESEGSGMSVLFGWGASFLVPEIDLQATLAVNRRGEPSLTIRTGILP